MGRERAEERGQKRRKEDKGRKRLVVSLRSIQSLVKGSCDNIVLLIGVTKPVKLELYQKFLSRCAYAGRLYGSFRIGKGQVL